MTLSDREKWFYAPKLIFVYRVRRSKMFVVFYFEQMAELVIISAHKNRVFHTVYSEIILVLLNSSFHT